MLDLVNLDVTSLNERQLAAVTTSSKRLLVLAGAGSGKTRVLVMRFTKLIMESQLSPYEILAVTFTNKAAREMKQRIESMLGQTLHGAWVGTFHNIALRLLRLHAKEAGLPAQFQVIDSDDQVRVLRRIQKDLAFDEQKWPLKQSQSFINRCKTKGYRTDSLQKKQLKLQPVLCQIYRTYEQACKQQGLVDFAELLLRSYELLMENDTLLANYRQHFRHILVDEFQDTNDIQYAWLECLLSSNNSFVAVGDDDQAIYSWRGAKVENIQKMIRDFNQVEVIRLEQNYRSTQCILSVANAVISRNTVRMGKKLWTAGEEGDLVSLFSASSEQDEANFVVKKIKMHHEEEGCAYQNMAIFYRSNAQSRILEETLARHGMPYCVYGGLRFFERAEIKDVLAYLRFIVNHDDDAALMRIINLPPRGIGQLTIQQLVSAASSQQLSLWKAIEWHLTQEILPARARKALGMFVPFIETLTEQVASLSMMPEQVEWVIEHSGLRAHFKRPGDESSLARVDNLVELVQGSAQFYMHYRQEKEQKRQSQSENTQFSFMGSFLAQIALSSGEYGNRLQNDDCVQLMTLHAAKGLEFQLVFLTGLEQGLFPHKLSFDDKVRLEEERRLCYVGMTRAMKKLYLTHAQIRHLYGQSHYHKPSIFINEIPKELLDCTISQTISKPANVGKVSTSLKSSSKSPFSLGKRVYHTRFGEGIVTNFEGKGAYARVQVRFTKLGSKWLVIEYANLVALH